MPFGSDGCSYEIYCIVKADSHRPLESREVALAFLKFWRANQHRGLTGRRTSR